MNQFPALKRYLAQLAIDKPMSVACPVLYHATRLTSLPSIMTHGLSASLCGSIHGAMEVRPAEKTIYLSSAPRPNNLNGSLFTDHKAMTHAVAVIAIDARALDFAKVYPDDALFVGFGNEDVLCDVDELVGSFRIPGKEAERFLAALTDASSQELVQLFKPLWYWYLLEHGEISVAHNIAPKYILEARHYKDGAPVNISAFRANKCATSPLLGK